MAVCRQPSTRGTETEQEQRGAMFREFWQTFNELIKDYKPNHIAVVFDFVEPDDGIPF